MDLPNARSIRPSPGERAKACTKAGETLVARHLTIAVDDIEKGLHW